jgi:hypothetical protein
MAGNLFEKTSHFAGSFQAVRQSRESAIAGW